ncbi:GNAT family N-acetyltransferase [Calothrix sp. 336/3]|uniref:GNAT family N-acetyltransferase n=1 Tax=Calothrix sp. 336/3 TaxID=1337936 RepID=UPI0004E41421|nr:GNAT family N-acetyltransferase [Calothrix sp. 336/3]AKG24629.1 acetyltransferase [Calothrix sp. 336/3]
MNSNNCPEQGTLQTQRLILRPLTLEDAASVQKLAGEREIAANTLSIPHPYLDGMAEEWIQTHPQLFQEGKAVFFGVGIKETGELCGVIGLGINSEHQRAEMGYWIGKPCWGKGFCTEATAELLRYGFVELGLNRIHACHFRRNPGSGRVMQKIGMKYEGSHRQHIYKWGEFEDTINYAILKDEWQEQHCTANS